MHVHVHVAHITSSYVQYKIQIRVKQLNGCEMLNKTICKYRYIS